MGGSERSQSVVSCWSREMSFYLEHTMCVAVEGGNVSSVVGVEKCHNIWGTESVKLWKMVVCRQLLE